MKQEKATFGAGCFWHVEESFRKLDGVTRTKVGYMGGRKDNPSYEDVCTGRTGHAEVCQVEYDPGKISYAELLDVFWRIHDPTQLNRQGPDIGDQYRSLIFYHTIGQKENALKSMEMRRRHHSRPIVTEIVPAGRFYPAEEYHQKYLQKKGLRDR